MQILEAGGLVALLRFLPDRRLLSLVTFDDQPAVVDVWSHTGTERVRIPLPSNWVRTLGPYWDSPWPDQQADVNAVAIHPDGDSFFIAWEGRLLRFRTADGASLPVAMDAEVDQVIISPTGNRFVAARRETDHCRICAFENGGEPVIWNANLPESYSYLAGFLPDENRFVTVDLTAVRIRSFDDNAELATTRFPASSLSHPLLSLDGKHLGASGYTSMYVFETDALSKPRRISGSTSFGNFISFAFHPFGHKLAVIHGGPSLVKMYDLATLKLDFKLHWKLGPLECVTFSPDGSLAAAGSQEGRIVVWEVEERP